MRNVRRVVLMMLTMVLLSSAAFAQSQATTGVIEGTVSDSSGAVLPGATVTLTNTGTNFTRDLVTNADGRYRGLLLPLGTYRLTVSLAGFSNYQQDGIELVVGQTANIPVVLQVGGVAEKVTVTSDSPVVETTRSEASTLINQQALRGLPNNGRNFLSFMQLTPGVTIVQGPDGDEISVNGQKGITNNISVDGADFNNPFFGEQRGGQRPAFTFNQDAIKEMLVVADGAAPEFGRSGSGFVNVVTKSGTNTTAGSAHVFFKHDDLSTKNSAGEKFPFDQEQFGATLGGPLRKDRLFYFLAYDEQQFDQTKQLDPSRIEPRVVDLFASLGSPDENGSIDRTNDARVLLGKIDAQITPNNLLTVRYNYTWSEQQNGTFDVDSWGRSANAVERDFSNAVSGSLATTLSSTMLHEFRFQFAREDRPRPYDGPDISGQTRPFPDTAFDFGSGYRFGEPFFIPVDYYDTRVQFVDNLSWIKGRHTIKGGFEFNRVNSVQTFVGFANGRYVFGSTDGFFNYQQLRPEIRRVLGRLHQPHRLVPSRGENHGPAPALSAAGRRRRPDGRRGGHTVHPAERAGALHSGQVAADEQPDDLVRCALGGAASARHDHAARSALLSWVSRQSAVSVGRHDSVRHEHVAAAPWPLVGSGRRWEAGHPRQRRHLLLADPGSEPGKHAIDRRHPRPDVVSRQHFNGFGVTPPDVAEPDPGRRRLPIPIIPTCSCSTRTSRIRAPTRARSATSASSSRTCTAFATFTHSKTVHVTRFINRNDAVFGAPWSRPGSARTEPTASRC